MLTDDNHQQLLAAATHKTRRQVEQMLADRAPKPDAKGAMRRLPTARPSPTRSQGADSPDASKPAEPQSLELTGLAGHPPASAASPTCPPPPPPSVGPRAERRGRTTPLGDQRYQVQFTANQQLHDQLQQAQELLRHQVPDGDLATIMGKAMTLLVEQLKKQRFGHTARPRGSNTRSKKPSKHEPKHEPKAKPKTEPDGATPCVAKSKDEAMDPAPKPGSRHIPAEVRRKVVERDGARCTFVSDSGRRCEAVGWLEFHHDDPFARGGPPTVDNIWLMCRSHNALMAEREFGRDFILQRRCGKRVNHPTIPEPSSG